MSALGSCLKFLTAVLWFLCSLSHADWQVHPTFSSFSADADVKVSWSFTLRWVTMASHNSWWHRRDFEVLCYFFQCWNALSFKLEQDLCAVLMSVKPKTECVWVLVCVLTAMFLKIQVFGNSNYDMRFNINFKECIYIYVFLAVSVLGIYIYEK